MVRLYLHVVNLADGKPLRKVPMGSVSGASAAIAGDRVFIGTYGSQVRCINYKTGDTLWKYELDADKPELLWRPKTSKAQTP